ncbi:MAG: hypothetical protein L6V95_13860 [Candidatus Melainabacteria bacterium]|nr:MAG: hypothetical protein L6V95_13860 [Candidatus Melainabacteria bacterium]
MYDTEAPNKAPITPPFEITPSKGQPALIEDIPQEAVEETTPQISEKTPSGDEAIVSYEEGDASSNNNYETSLNNSFETHNPLNHQSVNKQNWLLVQMKKSGS